VLPPTVLGFYLLILFAPATAAGRAWRGVTGDSLAFSFAGLVVGCSLAGLPYALQPVLAALRSVPRDLLDAGTGLGSGSWATYRRLRVPLAARGILAGGVLAFAHTLGEFGVVMMLGASLPGRTRVASVALFEEIQRLNYPAAHALAATQLALALGLILLVVRLRRERAPG
jgi:molybdate transport system permease protein